MSMIDQSCISLYNELQSHFIAMHSNIPTLVFNIHLTLPILLVLFAFAASF